MADAVLEILKVMQGDIAGLKTDASGVKADLAGVKTEARVQSRTLDYYCRKAGYFALL